MGADETDFEGLMRRIAGGSETAVWTLLDKYSKNILRLVRRRLPNEIRSKVDSVDIVQSVWKSLLRKGPNLEAFDTAEQLVAYIAKMAQNKVFEAHRHFTQRAGTDIRREARFSPAGAVNRRDRFAQSSGEQVDWRGDTPSAIAQAKENWECALSRMGDRGKQILQMKLRGATTEEIATETGLCARTVRRAVAAALNSLEI